MIRPDVRPGARLCRQRSRQRVVGLEKGVLQGLAGGRPAAGVKLEQVRQEAERLVARARQELPQRGGHERRVPELHLRRQLEALGPRLRRRRAEHGADLVHLVRLARAREQGTEGEELRHDAPARPGVDGRVVVRGPHQDLRRPVPSRRHVLRVGWPGAGFSRQPEVRYLDGVALQARRGGVGCGDAVRCVSQR